MNDFFRKEYKLNIFQKFLGWCIRKYIYKKRFKRMYDIDTENYNEFLGHAAALAYIALSGEKS